MLSRGVMLSKFFNWFAVIIAVAALAVDLLLIAPAPRYQLWMAAIAITELSLSLCVFASIAFVCTLFTFRNGAHIRRKALFAAIFLSTVCLTAMPNIQALIFGQQRNIPLSFQQYFGGAKVPDTGVLRDVQFAEIDGVHLALDIYGGAQRSQLAPAVIVIHGGAWRGGKKGDFHRSSEWLAHQGFVVFDINYRLATKGTTFPAQLYDVEKAIDWVRAHAEEYGADGSRIALCGRSAGAQLAILAAYRDSKRASSTKGEVRCVVSFYAPTDMEWDYMNPAMFDVIHAQEVIENYLGGSPAEQKATYIAASPTAQASVHAVPTLLLHGERDQIVRFENVQFLTSKLDAAKVPYEVVAFPWANHGFDANPNGWASQISNAETVRFLKRYMAK